MVDLIADDIPALYKSFCGLYIKSCTHRPDAQMGKKATKEPVAKDYSAKRPYQKNGIKS